jgi:hypothetical protein
MLFPARCLALASCLCASTLAQTFESNIPEEEAAALSQIVEDEVPDVALRKGGESPEYPLQFRQPLPIPPVAQPKM